MMDEFWLTTSTRAIKYTGPIIRHDRLAPILESLSTNTQKITAGKLDWDHTKKLFISYLKVCDTAPFSSSHSDMEQSTNVLSAHILALTKHVEFKYDKQWSKTVSSYLARIIPYPFTAGYITCAIGTIHFPDHLWFCSSTDNVVRRLDYFGCQPEVFITCKVRGTLAQHYSRCYCGRWYRPFRKLK